MDPEVKSLLEENLKVSKENNRLLHKVRSVQRWAQLYQAVKWIIIIGLSFGAFYFIQPYIESLLNVYSDGVSSVNKIKNVGDSLGISKIQDLLKGK